MNRKARLLIVASVIYFTFYISTFCDIFQQRHQIHSLCEILFWILFCFWSFLSLWTVQVIELCSNVYQNVNLMLSILPFFRGVDLDAFIGHIRHNFWYYLFLEILWQKSRHWDVAIFLHSSNFCAMVIQCVYCILLFLCVHLLPHFYVNLVKRCHSLILHKDTKRL